MKTDETRFVCHSCALRTGHSKRYQDSEKQDAVCDMCRYARPDCAVWWETPDDETITMPWGHNAEVTLKRSDIDAMCAPAADNHGELTQPERYRALHRVVRAMHDGHCPNCGHLGTSDSFLWTTDDPDPDECGKLLLGHRCPACGFATYKEDEETALKLFKPFMEKAVAIWLDEFCDEITHQARSQQFDSINP